MIETEAQKIVVKAVEAEGGYALKMSNRFLVGIPDLLIKLPTIPAMILEAKIQHFKRPDNHKFTLAATALQDRELRNMRSAGMITGMLSFVEIGQKGIKGLYMGVFSEGGTVEMSQHQYMGQLPPIERTKSIVRVLRDYVRWNQGHE